jgi:hypothetical protein
MNGTEYLQRMAAKGRLKKLAAMMAERMGRNPTEDEVVEFIFGNAEIRLEILNGDFHGYQPRTSD